MATNKKKAVYFPVSKAGTAVAGAFLRLQLDPDFYSVAVLAKIGAFNSLPDDTKPDIPTNIRYATKSGCVTQKLITISNGVEPNIKTRVIPILVGRESLDTIMTLKGDTVQIGRGADTKPWKVESVA